MRPTRERASTLALREEWMDWRALSAGASSRAATVR